MSDFLSSKTQKLRLTTPSLPRLPIPLRPLPALSIPQSEDHAATMATTFPRPIPPEKLEAAVDLYQKYIAARTDEALARRDAAPPVGFHPYLTVPDTPARSSASRTSSRRPRVNSESTVDFDAMTDHSSVVSFHGNDHPSPSNSLSYTGEVVQQSRRRRFSPAKRLKTHLIRLLGACHECHGRGISCDLEKHHDVAHLQRIIDERHRQSLTEDAYQTSSSTSNASQRTARSASGHHEHLQGSSHNDLLGLGAQLLPTFGSGNGTPKQEVQSPGGDLLSGITPGASFADLRIHHLPLDRGTELYNDHGNGAVIIIGVQIDDYFYCQHFSGCHQRYQDAEALQDHFEHDHFAFNRLDPAIHHICLFCQKQNESAWLRCRWCCMHSNIQTQVRGHFIRAANYGYDPGTGPAPLPYNPPATIYYPHIYAPSVNDAEAGPNDYGDLGSDSNYGMYGGNPSDSHPYGGPSDQGYDFNGYNNTGPGNNLFQGNFYRSARQMAVKYSVSRVLYANAIPHSQRLKQLLLLILLLVISLVCLTHDEIISKLQTTFPRAGPEIREHLPTIGFIVLFISFGATFLVKHRNHPSSSAQSQSVPCSLRVLSPYTKRYGEMAASPYIRCSEHL